MLTQFIRYFFIISCSIYIYNKILKLAIYSRFQYFYQMAFSLLLSVVISLVNIYNSMSKILVTIILTFIFFSYVHNTNVLLSFSALLISYSLSFISYILSNAITSLICSFFLEYYSFFPRMLIYFIIGTIQFIIVQQSLKNSQFNRGLCLLAYKNHLFTVSSFFILCIILLSNQDFSEFSMRAVICILLLLSSFLLLYYWRYRIKQTYIENMRRLETISYENAIMDRDKQIKELKQGNAELGQIIHKYRKVIPAMELSVTELLQSSSTLAPEELNNRALALRTQLEELRSERNNLLDKYQKDTIVMAQSGLHTVDAMIALMEKRAKQEGIRYRTQIDPTLKELALNSVKESDLLHLLGDMIENAIHAVSLTEDKEILIHLGKLNDCLLLEVSDSGISFDIQTYQHFGNEPFTSHQSDGGSGTGLMDLWKLKREYKASLYIYEYSSEHEVYTKKISLLFDRKNHFLLKTYRDKEIKNSLIRGDLHVFPHQTD